MAACGSESTVNDAVELEVMRREDSSWHHCQVSLCPIGIGLIVDYGNNDSEDIIVNEEEALARLRIRSLTLQGDDCSHIQEGDHVLATHTSHSKSLFFDAEVEKALRVRHSKKIYCRCTFMIKWLHQDSREALIVPSGSIMKLATKSINVHPTISVFLRSVRTSSGSSISPSPTVVRDIDCEMDLHELLEKQIEEITNSADVSKNKIMDDILLGFEVDTKRQFQCRAVAASNVSASHVQVHPNQNHLKRSTRSWNKLQTAMEVKDPPPPAPSIQEVFPENKSPLNPLAARAALASLMSKLPQNLEFSICHEEGKSFTFSSDITTHKQVTVESLSGSKSYNSSDVNNSSTTDKLSSKIEAATVQLVPKPGDIVRSLFSTGNSPGNPQLVDVSSEVLTNEWENEKKTPEITDSSVSLTCSTTKRKISQPIKAIRLTRAAVQKGIRIPNDDRDKKSCVEEMQLRSSTKRRRLTCSAVHKDEEIRTIETKKIMEENITAQNTESDSSDQNLKDHDSYTLKDKKLVTSPLDAEIDLLPSEERESLVKKEQRNKKPDIVRKTCAAEIKNSNKARRLTRSAVHEETGNKTMEAIQGLKDNKFSECVIPDLPGGNVTVLEINVLEAKKPISSPLHAEISLAPMDERNNQRKLSGAIKTTPKAEGIVAGSGESSQGLKRKLISSRKQELRVSPRLRFLPRTRSQNKS